ncbi:MAG: 16S rRNA (cytidine(1402)-2'-O)-methyltransferase [Geminicoccaceae bacterium]|nr:16S rRNA (cytidine(1402)-2'-O)-methyltransferase [Geminicoccaceae bacterium]
MSRKAAGGRSGVPRRVVPDATSPGGDPRAEGSAGEQPSKLGVGAPDGTLRPGLYVVGTPIGNLGDIGRRAATVLGQVDLVLCEDSRVTGRLLAHLNVQRPLLAYHDHNGERIRPQVIERLVAGERMALVSDAGTPCLADPGFKLVRAAAEAGIEIFAVPGPSSVIAALSISGLPTDRFFFQGFLPVKRGERLKVLGELAPVPGTLVFLEAPTRLPQTISDCLEVLGDRPAAMARELTKLFEEVRRARLTELAATLAGGPALKGEIVLLIGAGAPKVADEAAIDAALRDALAEQKPGRAAARVAAATGLPRDMLYRRALALK